MKKLTKEWVAKAEADFRVADTLQHAQPPVHDARCFHCQQAAEKYLKAVPTRDASATVTSQSPLLVRGCSSTWLWRRSR